MSDGAAEKLQLPQRQPQPQPPPRPKVKSYLHKFYDRSGAVKDPALFDPGAADEADELRRLLSSDRRVKPRGCHLRPLVWKAMLWIGVNCLIFGALGLAIAFFLPHEPEMVEVPGAQGFVRSQANADWNRGAGVLKYVALGIFGCGAVVTAVGLILPSLVWRLFDEEEMACGQPTESCCSGGTTGACAVGRGWKSQKPPASEASLAAAAAAATPAETPALACLVDERQVQPPRGPEEGHVSRGQVIK